MAWKLSLFGYREREVNEYLRALSEAGEAELDALREKIKLAAECKERRTAEVAALRQEASNRRKRLSAVETRLILVYFGEVSRREKEETEDMEREKDFKTGLLGVAPRELEEYLALRDRNHQAALGDLSEKLSQLEKAIAAQNEEIEALEALLDRPEMRRPFIDLAERFLSRFERLLEDAARENLSRRERRRESGGEREGFLKDAFLSEGVQKERIQEESIRSESIRSENMRSENMRSENMRSENMRSESELRFQIARCRRKVNALLRDLKRQEAAKQPGRPGREADKLRDLRKDAGDVIETAYRGDADGRELHRLRQEAAKGAFKEEASGMEAVSAVAGAAAEVAFPAAGAAGPARAADDGTNPGNSLKFRYLTGKIAGNDLKSGSGGLLVRKGQVIGPDEAEAACQQGLLEQLVRDLA